jgi:hypothetical protein
MPERQCDRALQHEQRALDAGLGLAVLRAAAGRDLHQILREGLGEAGHRARQHPEPRVGPAGQALGDDVAQNAAGEHGVGLGEHGAAGVQRRLRRQAGLGGAVSRAHDAMSFRR